MTPQINHVQTIVPHQPPRGTATLRVRPLVAPHPIAARRLDRWRAARDRMAAPAATY